MPSVMRALTTFLSSKMAVLAVPRVVDDNPDFVASFQSKQSPNKPLFRPVESSIESKQHDGLQK